METNKAGIQEKIDYYKGDVEALVRYLPWLESKRGEKLSKSVKSGEEGDMTMVVPIYDSTLLAFVKLAGKTKFINKNYVYTYSHYKIKDSEDEKRVISNAQIMDIASIGDILSKYILKGQVKGSLWSEGVENGVFFELVKKMKELIEFWSVPM